MSEGQVTVLLYTDLVGRAGNRTELDLTNLDRSISDKATLEIKQTRLISSD